MKVVIKSENMIKEDNKVKRIIIIIDGNRYRITQGVGKKLVINKCGEDSDSLIINPAYANQIELS